jgi:hypothetical protein
LLEQREMQHEAASAASGTVVAAAREAARARMTATERRSLLHMVTPFER